MKIKVTVFEDNNSLRKGLYQLINGSEGFECAGAFEDCIESLKILKILNPMSY